MSLNDDGWQEIFSQLKVADRVNEKRYFDITADQIKKISKREPRLMAKIDFREHIPAIMAKEGMAILAIANGTYRIGRFNPFIDIETDPVVAPYNLKFPPNIITLNPQKMAHESAALDAALLSGILKKVFGEDIALTIRGRTRSPDLIFSLAGIDFPISGVQIEVDGGYEGIETVNLVEAKVGSRNNLNVRQLIYPQLAWEKVVGHRKKVRTFICFYQEPILRFIPVLYENGACRVDHSRELSFILEPDADLDLDAIQAKPYAALPKLGVPFPQADKFEKVLAMFNIVAREESITKEALLLDFDVDPRQIDYYSNAMRWMGLVRSQQGVIDLTDSGRVLAKMTHARKMKWMAEIIFSEPIFNHVLRYGPSDVPPALFVRWRCDSETTRQRRLQTVKAWVSYFKTFTTQKKFGI